MATRNSTRRAGRPAYAGGNRPQTNPTQPRNPSPRPAAMREPRPADASPFSPDNAFAKDLRRRLELIHAVLITVAIALAQENAEHEGDFAAVLTRCAADPLWGAIVDHLGGEDDES